MKDFVALPLTICGPMGIVRELRRGEGGMRSKDGGKKFSWGTRRSRNRQRKRER